jgi:predicted DNA-binding protein
MSNTEEDIQFDNDTWEYYMKIAIKKYVTAMENFHFTEEIYNNYNTTTFLEDNVSKEDKIDIINNLIDITYDANMIVIDAEEELEELYNIKYKWKPIEFIIEEYHIQFSFNK